MLGRWHQRVLEAYRGGDLTTVDWVEIHMASVLIVESNHRRGVIWKAEADMRGGHDVQVGAGDEDPKRFHA